MPDKKAQSQPQTKPADLPSKKAKLTAEEQANVKGGMLRAGSDLCKESGDSGAMGCPG